MKLLVIRHAIAMDKEEYHTTARRVAREAGAGRGVSLETNDDYRPLTEEGIRKMRKNARGLRKKIERPELLVTSPLTRAIQTAEIVRDAWTELDMATCDELRPGSEPGAFARWLRSQPQAEKSDALIAIVGHEPHLSTLIGWLVMGAAESFLEFKKGGACLLEFNKGIEKGKARMMWLATPSMLRSL